MFCTCTLSCRRHRCRHSECWMPAHRAAHDKQCACRFLPAASDMSNTVAASAITSHTPTCCETLLQTKHAHMHAQDRVSIQTGKRRACSVTPASSASSVNSCIASLRLAASLASLLRGSSSCQLFHTSCGQHADQGLELQNAALQVEPFEMLQETRPTAT